uniref:Uncharacterized protein n=1 Tax=Tanacetum cinerariifolium TaxID=118510 RepID=A0A699J5B1_TANCI|nr:hypothetical protein [Tanacetum cinerariifolium]
MSSRKVKSAAPITAATITAAPSAARRRKEVVIRDPKETATPSTIVHSEPKSKDKGKEAELNKNINWDDVIEQVKRKENKDNVVLRYQALNRKPQIEAQAKKNMMHFNSVVGFLEKSEKELEEEESRALNRKSKSDFLVTTLKAMFKKPDVEAHIWKNQRGIHGLAKVKNWKLLELQGIYSKGLLLLVKDLLLLVQVKLLDDAADSRLRLLEQSAAADDKMKK